MATHQANEAYNERPSVTVFRVERDGVRDADAQGEPLAIIFLTEEQWKAVNYIDYLDIDVNGELSADIVAAHSGHGNPHACHAMRVMLRTSIPSFPFALSVDEENAKHAIPDTWTVKPSTSGELNPRDFLPSYATHYACDCTCSSCEMARDAADNASAYDEPKHDDTVRCCPDCERPNQFGELCVSCSSDQADNSPNYEIEDLF